MLNYCEGLAIKIGAPNVCLWVEKNSWMHQWYARRGYLDGDDKEDQENTIWMKKGLQEVAPC